MKSKIFRYVSISMAVVLAAAMAVMILILNNHFISLETSRLESEAMLVQAGIDAGSDAYLKSLDASDDANYRITWIAANGDVLYDSKADASQMENHSDRAEFKEALSQGSGVATRYSHTMAIRTIYAASKCADGSVIRVAENYDTAGILTMRMISPILIILIAAITVASLLARRLADEIAEPINTLDLDHPLQQDTYDEIQPLLVRIDKQNEQIDEQLNELHQKKKEFETVTSSISEGIILLNRNEEIVSINDAARSLFDKTDDMDVHTLDDLCGSEQMHRLARTTLAGGSSEEIIQFRDADIRLTGHPITSHGVLTGASILACDITSVYEAEQTRREFTANVSHELKTPLQSIMGSAELLENHLVKPEDTDKFIHKIRFESARMLTLIDDIIRLSQLDENASVEVSRLQLKDLAREAHEAVAASAKKRNITISMDLHDAPIKANNRLVYEIAYNLLDNAIRYNHENGSVTVKTWHDADHHLSILSVADTGIGIPHEAQSRIFERFYRVDKSHSRATGGTGLGLSIVKHAAAICGARITLTSELGKGSVFTVKFPEDPGNDKA